MTRHVIPRIRGGSLAVQLAGYGLIRVLAEQIDPAVRSHFDGSALVLDSIVEDVASWLVDVYRPTPVLSPWKEGSGFGAKDKTPREALSRLLDLPTARVDEFRHSYAAVAPIAEQARSVNWSKARVVVAVRNACPDSMLPWVDASVVVLSDDKLGFPPIFGSGGNDGNLDFSTNFHQRLLEVLEDSPKQRAAIHALAVDLLTGTATAPLSKAAVGQFDPAGTGMPNSAPTGAAESVVNPWVFVLMVEGAMLFASAPARRLSADAGIATRAAMTFMTHGDAAGSVTAAPGEDSRGEIWAPSWNRSLSFAAVRQIFNEGRAVWRGRTASTSGQMYLAASSQGVASGVAAFERYTIVKRNGKSYAAVRTDEVTVRGDSATKVVEDVEEWPERVRNASLSGSIARPLREFTNARVEVARLTPGPKQVEAIRAMLSAITDLELAISRSSRGKEAVGARRVPGADSLNALFGRPEWAVHLARREFRIALGLASFRTRPLVDAPNGRALRHILLAHDSDGRRTSWREKPLVSGYAQRDLVAVLGDVTTWLTTTAQYTVTGPSSDSRPLGVSLPTSGVAVAWSDLHAWVGGRLDEAELACWLHALIALDWRAVQVDLPRPAAALIDPEFAAIAAFRSTDVSFGDGPRRAMRSEWVTQLRVGHVDRAAESARLMLRLAGLQTSSARTDRYPPAAKRGALMVAALLPRSRPSAPLHRSSYRESTELATVPEEAS